MFGLTALVMLSIILLLLMLAKGLSAPMHSVYLGVIVLMEVLLFFLSSPDSVSQALSPVLLLFLVSAESSGSSACLAVSLPLGS